MPFRTVLPKSQTQSLLDHFKVTPNISAMEAHSMYKIRALPRRIKDLKELGYTIHSQNKVDATGQRYVRYHFVPMKVSHQ